jgi:hypothetical protein
VLHFEIIIVMAHSIVIGYELENRGSILSNDSIFLFSLPH